MGRKRRPERFDERAHQVSHEAERGLEFISMPEEIRRIAKKAYQEEDYNYHIVPVARNALALAKRLDADPEVVEVAAYLHDISKTQMKREKVQAENEHHVLGARETRKILTGLGCDKEFIKKVEHCILAHRGQLDPNPETKEAEIVACADAMAYFDTFPDSFRASLTTCKSFEDALKETEEKTERKWNKLTLPKAKEIAEPKYKAIKLLIKSMAEYLTSD